MSPYLFIYANSASLLRVLKLILFNWSPQPFSRTRLQGHHLKATASSPQLPFSSNGQTCDIQREIMNSVERHTVHLNRLLIMELARPTTRNFFVCDWISTTFITMRLQSSWNTSEPYACMSKLYSKGDDSITSAKSTHTIKLETILLLKITSCFDSETSYTWPPNIPCRLY